jgi:hypothetical protein
MVAENTIDSLAARAARAAYTVGMEHESGGAARPAAPVATSRQTGRAPFDTTCHAR